ncbi:MAG TPA: hypothetical protein VF290_02515 [Pyrinomonadaceae bacterium]
MSESKEQQPDKQQDTIADMLSGSCSVGFLDCSIVEFAQGVKYFIDQESQSVRCDTHLINVLRRAACAAWELANIQGPSLMARLAEARRNERQTITRAIKRLPYETRPGEANHNEATDFIKRKDVLASLAEKES